jgi:hypothetical protein
MNPPPLGSAASQPQQSGLALASMILGICGIALCLGPLSGIPAVICGHMAHSRIKQSGGAVGGLGMATAGLIMGYFSFAMIFVVGMMVAVAAPNFIKARNNALSQHCRSNLRTIQSAKEVWALQNRKSDDSIPTEADLVGPGNQMAALPVCNAGGVYSFNPVRENPSCSVHGALSERWQRR